MDNKFDEDFMNKYADENKKAKKSDGYEDISSNSDRSKPHMLSEMTEKEKKRKSGKRKPLTKKQKAVIITVACILGVIILGAAVVFGGALGILDKIGDNVDNKFEEPEIAEEDLEALEKMNDISNAASLKDLLKKWATNGGKKMSSKNVINILLLGLDGSSSEEGTTRSDVMLLVSVNKKTQKITFTSFLRDSYTYMKMKKGNEMYTKLTESYFYGGPDLVVQCIENDYKIDIDGYAVVNFETFPKVIDALGGVEIDITEREAKYLRSTKREASSMGGVGNIQSGTNVHVTGKQALAFCRIRAIDSDNERSRRQRDVITAVGKKVSSASLKQLNNLLNELLPYIKTDLSSVKMLSLATQAISSGWINYEQVQLEVPQESERKSGYTDGGKWIWIVDYPGAAVKLQNALYGTSNIKLPDNRVTALDLKSSSKSSSSSSSSSSSKSGTSTTKQAVETTSEVIEETTKKQGIFPFIDDDRQEENTEAPVQEQEEPNTEKKEESTWWFENIVA